LLPGYPYPTFEATVLAASKLFSPREPADAIAEVGRAITIATIDASPVGKHLLPLLKLMGTGRALRRVYSKSTGENSNQVSFGAETPRSLEMSMSDVGNIPDMARGSILGMGDAMGVSLRARLGVSRAEGDVSDRVGLKAPRRRDSDLRAVGRPRRRPRV